MNGHSKEPSYWPRSYFDVRDSPLLRFVRYGRLPSEVQVLDKYLAFAIYGGDPDPAKGYGWVRPKTSHHPDQAWLIEKTHLSESSVKRARTAWKKSEFTTTDGHAVSVLPILQWIHDDAEANAKTEDQGSP